jgi:Sodium/calcium exchanger protein
MLACVFSVVRHADAIARQLGEPYGTLVLTISVITIEVSLMAAIILNGEKPTLARDPMFATLMIVLNGMVGTAHMGAMRYSKGARSFLAVIALLAVFALIMPDLTKNRTRSEPIALPSRAARRHHHSFLCHLPHHPERAAPILLRRTVQRQGETVAYLVAHQTRPLGPLWYHVHRGGARHWNVDRLRGASWARPRRCRASRADAVRERAHFWRRQQQLQGTVHLFLFAVYTR